MHCIVVTNSDNDALCCAVHYLAAAKFRLLLHMANAKSVQREFAREIGIQQASKLIDF